ncbi:MAG: hypothetical protein ACAF41_34510 (plasmid) [Leptolyngbya sp. BL-A-14]
MSTLISTRFSSASRSPFAYVREWADDFLALFPHRYDYIWSKRPQPGEKPVWKTEKKHPLSDRMLRQGKHLYGVRCGQSTNYLLIDIDIASPYHPNQDPQAIPLLLGALEPLGLVTPLACTSSYSGGLHLYFPFAAAQNSYQLADVTTTLLEHSGFQLAPGQLELFPNCKLYVTDSEPSLFAAHRLPLQEPGSYILNCAWESTYTDTSAFVRRWQFAQTRNTLTSETLAQVLRTRKRKYYKRLSKNAAKFLSDLDAEIEAGWTGPGQTNYLLGRLTMREYIFHHVINGGSPLAGEALVKAVVAIAQALPGYTEWCRHQHELDQKVVEWARSIEASHYYHYGDDPEPKKSTAPNWNQQQQAAARTRITQALADLLNHHNLPSGITARRNAIVQYGISQSTLTKHKDLWHPQFLAEPPTPPSTEALHPNVANPAPLQQAQAAPDSLLQSTTTNKLETPSDSDAPQQASAGRSLTEVGGCGGISTGEGRFSASSSTVSESQTGAATKTQAMLAALKLAEAKARSDAYAARMQQYLASGDPILMAEAFAWAERNPDLVPQVCTSFSMSEQPNLDDRPLHLADLLAAIAVLLQRLQWTPEQVSDRLWALFGKRSQAHLDDRELARWRLWLEEQVVGE